MLKSQKGETLDVEQKVFAGGGEGELFLAKGRKRGLVFKRYFDSVDLQEKERKIDFMLRNSPLKNAPQVHRNAVIWPEEMIYEYGKFKGYLMPLVKDTVALNDLNKQKIKYNAIGQQWEKFDFKSTNAQFIRLRIVANVAHALRLIHASGNYVLKDFKPENVRIDINGIVSLVDMDSIQIIGKSGEHYLAEVATKEYCPPEYSGNQQQLCRPSWDYFSFAVTAYRILVLAHPFSMIPIPNPLQIDEYIEKGYYAHLPKFQGQLSPFHKPFLQLPKAVQDCFNQCFIEGVFQPNQRPDFNTWIQVIEANLQLTYKKPTCTLTANRKAVPFGKRVLLIWTSKEANQAYINGKPVNTNGSASYVISGKDKFTLTVSNSQYQESAEVQVDTIHEPVVDFRADAYHVSKGRKISLKWKITPRKMVDKVLLNGELFRWSTYKSIRVYQDVTHTLEVFCGEAIITKRIFIQVI